MGDTPPVTAREIAQQMLDKTGHALIAGDVASFTACFRYPQELDSFEGRRMIQSADEMAEIFHNVRKHFDAMGVTSLVRHVIDASFQGATKVVTTHETRLLNNTRLVQEPYPVSGTIEQGDAGWQITFSQYAIADTPALNAALHSGSPRQEQNE